MARKCTKLSQMDVCYIPEFSRPIVPLTDIYRLGIEQEIKKKFFGEILKNRKKLLNFLIFCRWDISRRVLLRDLNLPLKDAPSKTEQLMFIHVFSVS